MSVSYLSVIFRYDLGGETIFFCCIWIQHFICTALWKDLCALIHKNSIITRHFEANKIKNGIMNALDFLAMNGYWYTFRQPCTISLTFCLGATAAKTAFKSHLFRQKENPMPRDLWKSLRDRYWKLDSRYTVLCFTSDLISFARNKISLLAAYVSSELI